MSGSFCEYVESLGISCARLTENKDRPYYEGRINPLKAGWTYVPSYAEPGPLPLTFRTDKPVSSYLDYALGWVYPQAHSSLLPVFSLQPAPDEIILDAFAAPGSKTTLMAAFMENRGGILASEISKRRIRALYGNIKRMGVLNTSLWLGDVIHIRGYFDAVLMDAPCTGMGSSHWEMGRIHDSMRKQIKYLSHISRRVKEGGRLVYSTCSLTYEENEMVVQWALEHLPLELVHHGLDIYYPGLTELGGERWKVLRINGPEIGSEAFFVAKFIKV